MSAVRSLLSTAARGRYVVALTIPGDSASGGGTPGAGDRVMEGA
ncbi:hypothetical protein M2161_001647 [Streptomyces sp. SAI-133]|nr:hypothetical protein [Streptomyces sp. SAI-041]MDH6582541.1 hypothetical protein [Streptomyces sp. SAI-133]